MSLGLTAAFWLVALIAVGAGLAIFGLARRGRRTTAAWTLLAAAVVTWTIYATTLMRRGLPPGTGIGLWRMIAYAACPVAVPGVGAAAAGQWAGRAGHSTIRAALVIVAVAAVGAALGWYLANTALMVMNAVQ